MDTLPNNPNSDLNNHAPETLLYEIKIRLQNTYSENLLKGMGYASTKNGLKTLEKFLGCNDICNWLRTGSYDFHYTSKEFLEKLSTKLSIDPSLYIAAINRCQKIDNELKKISGCHVYVNTNFHRANEPIFVLATMEGRRRLVPDKQELMFKTDAQIFDFISNLVKKHYSRTRGNLLIWGKIDNYVYHHFDGKQYVFDNNGSLLDSSVCINESRATLSIK